MAMILHFGVIHSVAGKSSNRPIRYHFKSRRLSSVLFVVAGPTPILTAATILSVSSTTVQLAWPAAISNVLSLTYLITVDGGPSIPTVVVSTLSASTTATIRGLFPGARYSFRVAGVNSIGSGQPASPPANATTDCKRSHASSFIGVPQRALLDRTLCLTETTAPAHLRVRFLRARFVRWARILRFQISAFATQHRLATFLLRKASPRRRVLQERFSRTSVPLAVSRAIKGVSVRTALRRRPCVPSVGFKHLSDSLCALPARPDHFQMPPARPSAHHVQPASSTLLLDKFSAGSVRWAQFLASPDSSIAPTASKARLQPISKPVRTVRLEMLNLCAGKHRVRLVSPDSTSPVQEGRHAVRLFFCSHLFRPRSLDRCNPGFFTPSPGTVSCSPCGDGFVSADGTLCGKSNCPAGTAPNPVTRTCQICSSATFSPGNGSPCILCPDNVIWCLPLLLNFSTDLLCKKWIKQVYCLLSARAALSWWCRQRATGLLRVPGGSKWHSKHRRVSAKSLPRRTIRSASDHLPEWTTPDG